MSKPLVAVDFKKGRGKEPRLSAPYVPGKRSERFWTEAERQVLRDRYEKKGMAYCLQRLPGRTPSGIYGEARKLGLKGQSHKRAPDGAYARDGIDDEIRAGWALLKGRNAVKEFAARLGVPRWWLTKRATRLGLTTVHKKEPPWTPAEDELLKLVPKHDPDRAATIFREHGFQRSPTAIIVRCTRAGLSRRDRPYLSGSAAARILGLDNKTFCIWCLKGWVKASRAGTRRRTQQGGDSWAITRADLRQFVIDNLDRIDIRKVDKLAFVDLLVNTAPHGDQDIAARGGAAELSVPRRAAELVDDARKIQTRAKSLTRRGIAAAHAAGAI